MKAKVKVNNQKGNETVKPQRSSDVFLPQSEAKGKPVFNPDYSCMMEEIKKITYPVSFDRIKDFYGVE